MRVEHLGTGNPEIAIVAGIHGDEPCGVRAVEQLLADRPTVHRPVKLVVANERALEADERYLEADLNRSFPGDPDADAHERRLANELVQELQDCTVLALHSTQSYDDPFAVVNSVSELTRSVCPALPIDTVVETGAFTEGRIFGSVQRAIEIECGYQGSDEAACNAEAICRAFLGAMDAFPSPQSADGSADELPVYRLERRVPKQRADAYEVFTPNFERVERGETFAAADDTELVADEPFYPVLMSANGYSDVFGYKAKQIAVVEP
jgi:succinylglutamate desuccinylase